MTIADKPGALGKCFLALADRGVQHPRLSVRHPRSPARVSAIRGRRLGHGQGGARQPAHGLSGKSPRRGGEASAPSGELGRAAARLGEKQINIDYSYCGLEPGSTLCADEVFGVDKLTTISATALDAAKPRISGVKLRLSPSRSRVTKRNRSTTAAPAPASPSAPSTLSVAAGIDISTSAAMNPGR